MSKKTSIAGLAIGALGVVYGDIGTSPLYAVKEVFYGKHRLAQTHDSIIGLISVVLWALILIVAIKYVIFILKADNEGEGGVFALLALLRRHKVRSAIVLVAVLTFAAGLLFGDGIITPAISVLSAVEGLGVADHSLIRFVIPLTIIILSGLFLVQRKGTAVIGKIFGPIVLVWFFAIAALGINQIIHVPAILQAFDPLWAIRFIYQTQPYELLIALGSVMLVVTGGEALYADMGHFGRTPIRLSWFSIVMPCLMLSYLGQGAFLLRGGTVVGNNLFFSLVPHVLLIPMIGLATMATIIASQALISGSFSLASQGIALGLIPRLRIKHTHAEHEGQIYLGAVNWALFAGCVVLVLVFKSSTNLAAAYGLAVSGVMFITALSALQLAKLAWGWSPTRARLVFGFFALIDAGFLTANSLKLLQGGFVPLGIGILLFIIMNTWLWGRRHGTSAFEKHSSISVGELVHYAQARPRLTTNVLILSPRNAKNIDDKLPPLAELFIKRFHAVPQHLIILTIKQTRRPYEHEDKRLDRVIIQNDEAKNQSIIFITARFGFMEEPNVENVVNAIAEDQTLTPNDNMEDWVIYAGRERITKLGDDSRRFNLLQRLRGSLYGTLMRNTSPSYEYFGLGDDARLSVELVPVRIK